MTSPIGKVVPVASQIIMTSGFPSSERNREIKQIKARIAADPRSSKLSQIPDRPPIDPPQAIARAAARGRDWGITRRMHGYVVGQDTGVQGKAPKWVLRGPKGSDDFYIAKLGSKNGKIEVYTELFNNQLGQALGFPMAHSGIVRLDGQLYFLTRNFRRGERLVHGSLLIEDLFAVERGHLDTIAADAEQEFYSVDFIRDAISAYCGVHGEDVFQQFVNMLLFDALIGSQDRHPMNWGVLRPETESIQPVRFRLAPLFDSARALLWDLAEGKLLKLDEDVEALFKYVRKAKPCIGPIRNSHHSRSCNHFDFIASLQASYPHQMAQAWRLIADKNVKRIAQSLCCVYPFDRGFTSLRKRVILKVLEVRMHLLSEALGK